MKKSWERKAISRIFTEEKLTKKQIDNLVVQFKKSSLSYNLRRYPAVESSDIARSLRRRVVRPAFPKEVSTKESRA